MWREEKRKQSEKCCVGWAHLSAMQTLAGCVDEKQSRAERGFGDMETEEDKDGNDEREKHLKSVKNDLCDFSHSCIWYDDDNGSGGDESENSRHKSWRMCQLSGWGLSLSATDALPTLVSLQQNVLTAKKLVNCNFFYSLSMRIRHMMWWLLVLVRQFTFVTLAKCLRSFSIIFSRICDHAVTVGVCGSSKKKVIREEKFTEIFLMNFSRSCHHHRCCVKVNTSLS